jgi:hypothetical protein
MFAIIFLTILLAAVHANDAPQISDEYYPVWLISLSADTRYNNKSIDSATNNDLRIMQMGNIGIDSAFPNLPWNDAKSELAVQRNIPTLSMQSTSLGWVSLSLGIDWRPGTSDEDQMLAWAGPYSLYLDSMVTITYLPPLTRSEAGLTFLPD